MDGNHLADHSSRCLALTSWSPRRPLLVLSTTSSSFLCVEVLNLSYCQSCNKSLYCCNNGEIRMKPTEWRSWGRRCISETRGGIQWTPVCLLSSRNPDSRSQETCTLRRNTDKTRDCVTGSMSRKSDPPDLLLLLHTCEGVVHIKAITFDFLQIHTSVDKHPVTERSTAVNTF